MKALVNEGIENLKSIYVMHSFVLRSCASLFRRACFLRDADETTREEDRPR
jgi:hypothetical protein